MIGCSGRSIFDKCANCGYFHDQGYKCPENNGWLYSKWKHSKGFRAEDTLYNYWFAKKYIEKTKTAIIVESPGNVWRLEESGIHNSVAIFGANISNKQKLLLDTSGAMNIVILTDTDIAGEKAKQQIITKFSQTYRIFCPIISKNDVADMSKEEIQSQIISYLESNKL
jgi:DNA primase